MLTDTNQKIDPKMNVSTPVILNWLGMEGFEPRIIVVREQCHKRLIYVESQKP
jgi:hypothetical protein